jgi:carbonic anhydrase
MIDSGQIGIVGGMHDIATGLVVFYPETMTLHSRWVNE